MPKLLNYRSFHVGRLKNKGFNLSANCITYKSNPNTMNGPRKKSSICRPMGFLMTIACWARTSPFVFIGPNGPRSEQIRSGGRTGANGTRAVLTALSALSYGYGVETKFEIGIARAQWSYLSPRSSFLSAIRTRLEDPVSLWFVLPHPLLRESILPRSNPPLLRFLLSFAFYFAISFVVAVMYLSYYQVMMQFFGINLVQLYGVSDWCSLWFFLFDMLYNYGLKVDDF